MRMISVCMSLLLILMVSTVAESPQTQTSLTPEITPIGDPDCPWDTAIRYSEYSEGEFTIQEFDPDYDCIAEVKRKRTGDKLTPPKIIKKVELVIPEEYKNQKVKVSIYIYEAVITNEGNVCGLKLIRKPENPLPGFEKAVVDALLQWKFEPGLKNGKPVPYIVTLFAFPKVR